MAEATATEAVAGVVPLLFAAEGLRNLLAMGGPWLKLLEGGLPEELLALMCSRSCRLFAEREAIVCKSAGRLTWRLPLPLDC